MPAVQETNAEYAARTRSVVIVNETPLDLWDQFNGLWYHIPAAQAVDGKTVPTGLRVTAEVASIWFGDRRVKNSGRPKDWNRELMRIAERVGGRDSARWKAMSVGTLYVREWGRGAEMYVLPQEARVAEFEGALLSEILGDMEVDAEVLQDVGGESGLRGARQAGRSAVGAQPDVGPVSDITEMVDGKKVTATVRRKEFAGVDPATWK